MLLLTLRKDYIWSVQSKVNNYIIIEKPTYDNKTEVKNYDQLVKGKKKEFIKKNRTKSFKKVTKTNNIKNAIHKNRKSQQLVRKKVRK